MGTVKDISNKKFGRLLSVKISHFDNNYSAIWECICDCGKIVFVKGVSLRKGSTKSCGCYKIDGLVKRSLKHGHHINYDSTPEYRAWCHMKTRCYTKTVERYPKYGGRGIIVCDRWKDSFENFLSDMGLRPSELHSLDRINVDGNYEPSNCRWATRAEQSRNTTKNHWIEYNGEKLILSDWAVKLKTSPGNINRMMNQKNRKTFEQIYNFHMNKIINK